MNNNFATFLLFMNGCFALWPACPQGERVSYTLLRSAQWHGLTQRWLILIWPMHVVQPGFVALPPNLGRKMLSSMNGHFCHLLSLCNVILFSGRNMYVIAHCSRCSVVTTSVRMWMLFFVACEWVPGRLNSHSVDSHHTHIPCVKGIIVKTEVMSGCQSICNTSMHKGSLSLHREQSTTDTDGGLSWGSCTLC